LEFLYETTEPKTSVPGLPKEGRIETLSPITKE
jgi:hypothetical protein